MGKIQKDLRSMERLSDRVLVGMSSMQWEGEEWRRRERFSERRGVAAAAASDTTWLPATFCYLTTCYLTTSTSPSILTTSPPSTAATSSLGKGIEQIEDKV